ncbi:TfoX/Sxy family protein [Methylopila sp. M107]|uniref:TfoX/Sxy family protein n=1 Tax=Methylopila sp. M107 TaxID=1101190 RepID=UPI000380B6E3|nr:TfoX/Sxy family protein [Methylopila sp. M107]
MAIDQDRADEIFAAFGPVRVKRMFSGVGVFVDGRMFALEARDVLYLKSDATTDPDFEREGCEAFSYASAKGRRVVMSYRRAPERLLEDPDEMAEWARRALIVAQAKQKQKRKSAPVSSR